LPRPTKSSPERLAPRGPGRRRAGNLLPERRGCTRGSPGATPENQQRFYEALLATGVPFVWFLAVDSPMHRTVSPPGGFGGLWDENWHAKPVVELLASAL